MCSSLLCRTRTLFSYKYSIVDADGSPSGSPRVEVAFRLGTANNFALGRRFREDRSELQRGGKHQNKCYWRARCGETNELYVRIHVILIVTLCRSTASGARGAYDWYTLPRENETLKILEATRTIFRRKNIPGIYIYLSFLMARNTARGVWFLLGFSLYLFLLEMNGSTWLWQKPEEILPGTDSTVFSINSINSTCTWYLRACVFHTRYHVSPYSDTRNIHIAAGPLYWWRSKNTRRKKTACTACTSGQNGPVPVWRMPSQFDNDTSFVSKRTLNCTWQLVWDTAVFPPISVLYQRVCFTLHMTHDTPGLWVRSSTWHAVPDSECIKTVIQQCRGKHESVS